MKITKIEIDQYQVMKWKNGLGQTYQIDISPQSLSENTIEKTGLQEEFDWRLSTAPVFNSGAFSNFHGYERILILLEGKGIKLFFKNAEEEFEKILKLGDQCHFSGSESVRCELIEGPVKDLNLIYNLKKIQPEVFVEKFLLNNNSDEEKEFEINFSGDTCVIYVMIINGQMKINDSGELLMVAEGECLKITPKNNSANSQVKIIFFKNKIHQLNKLPVILIELKCARLF